MRPLGLGTAALEIQPVKHSASDCVLKPPRACATDHSAIRNNTPLEAITAPMMKIAIVSTHEPLANPLSATSGDVMPPSTHVATSTSAMAASGSDSHTINGTSATNVAAACHASTEKPCAGGISQ